MGQSPNESHGFETNGNKYKCVGHSKMGWIPPQSERPKCYSQLDMNLDDVSS